MDPTTITAFTQLDPMSVKYLMEPSVIQANASAQSSYFGLFIAGVFVIAIILFWSSLFEERKSMKYRKVVTDMYAAGAIRKLAKEDQIDIDEEYKNFKKFEKKSKRDYKELDEVIEENLKEKSQEKNDQDIERLNSTSNKKA